MKNLITNAKLLPQTGWDATHRVTLAALIELAELADRMLYSANLTSEVTPEPLKEHALTG